LNAAEGGGLRAGAKPGLIGASYGSGRWTACRR